MFRFPILYEDVYNYNFLGKEFIKINLKQTADDWIGRNKYNLVSSPKLKRMRQLSARHIVATQNSLPQNSHLYWPPEQFLSGFIKSFRFDQKSLHVKYIDVYRPS